VYDVAPERRGGVFQQLLDPAVFNSVAINPDFGCVEWPGGIDLCPTTMHEELFGQRIDPSPLILRESPKRDN
jgi:hypothetical protein